MPIIDLSLWNIYVEKNLFKYQYGKSIIDLSREVMKIIDELDEEKELIPSKIIDMAYKNINPEKYLYTNRIYECIVTSILMFHSRGIEFSMKFYKGA
jgi:hypothetical protein